MPRHSRLRPLFFGIFLGATTLFALRAQSQNDTNAQLATYRAALAQIGAGQSQNARLLLENSRNHGDLPSESALLLAFLQDQNGQSEQARATLSHLETPSPLVLAYRARLNTPRSVEVAAPTNLSPDNEAHLSPSDARISKLEREMFVRLNETRAANNLRPLVWNDNLAAVARSHSAEMRDKKYFAHDSPTTQIKEPLDRYRLGYGQTPRLVAENIYRVWGGRSFLTEKDVGDAHTALMNSPGHRANILLSSAVYGGIGMTTDSTGNLWITQMFSKPF